MKKLKNLRHSIYSLIAVLLGGSIAAGQDGSDANLLKSFEEQSGDIVRVNVRVLSPEEREALFKKLQDSLDPRHLERIMHEIELNGEFIYSGPTL